MDIDGNVSIPDDELEWTFSRSGGPGGQNVNKVASKAQLRWAVAASTVLPEEVRDRLLTQQRNRITTDGDLLISSQIYRDQERNRQSCVDKLGAMIEKARHVPIKRRPTRPSRGARESRLEDKRRRSAVKTGRQVPSDD